MLNSPMSSLLTVPFVIAVATRSWPLCKSVIYRHNSLGGIWCERSAIVAGLHISQWPQSRALAVLIIPVPTTYILRRKAGAGHPGSGLTPGINGLVYRLTVQFGNRPRALECLVVGRGRPQSLHAT